MRIENACTPSFARHETFHPRYGWLKKAHDGAAEDKQVFISDQATVVLGVGKNMVRSIRFWGLASRVICEQREPKARRASGYVPTRIGSALLSDGGWDPYFEHMGTLWLFHWWLLAPPSLLPVWWSAFNDFGPIVFAEPELTSFSLDQVRAVSAWNQPHESSIAKDVSCLLRTFSDATLSSRDHLEDGLDCPFRELGLLQPASDARSRSFRFNLGPKVTLPPEILLFAAIDFVLRTDGSSSQTLTLSRIAAEAGAPGAVFRLSEHALHEGIEAAVRLAKGVRLTSVAGVTQLQFTDDPADVGDRLLHQYYTSRKRGTRRTAGVAGPTGDEPVRILAESRR